jgi:hypothetical protein
MADQEQHRECVNRFIALANTMKDEGILTNVVSAGLMTASGIYASYLVGGNEGGLSESGIDKVVAVYKRELERIESVKKEQSGA